MLGAKIILYPHEKQREISNRFFFPHTVIKNNFFFYNVICTTRLSMENLYFFRRKHREKMQDCTQPQGISVWISSYGRGLIAEPDDVPSSLEYEILISSWLFLQTSLSWTYRDFSRISGAFQRNFPVNSFTVTL